MAKHKISEPRIVKKCIFCGEAYFFKMTAQQIEDFMEKRKTIQEIIPDVEPELRELFISGICPNCYPPPDDELTMNEGNPYPYDEDDLMDRSNMDGRDDYI